MYKSPSEELLRVYKKYTMHQIEAISLLFFNFPTFSCHNFLNNFGTTIILKNCNYFTSLHRGYLGSGGLEELIFLVLWLDCCLFVPFFLFKGQVKASGNDTFTIFLLKVGVHDADGCKGNFVLGLWSIQ